MKKAREEKKAAEAAARRERGEPEPTEPPELNEEEKLEKKLDEIQKKGENAVVIDKAEHKGATVEEVQEKTIDTREP